MDEDTDEKYEDPILTEPDEFYAGGTIAILALMIITILLSFGCIGFFLVR